MSDLKTRARYTNSVDIETLEAFKKIAIETKIPQSKLLDEAMLDLITKYGLKKSTIQ